MNLIFLDFDETMNSVFFRHTNKEHIRAERKANPGIYSPENRHNMKYIKEHIKLKSNEVDPEAMRNLALIVNKTNAKIVICSSWRNQSPFFHDDNIEIIRRFQHMFNLLGYPEIEVIGITPTIGFRGAEIADYLDNFTKTHQLDNYIIIDDGGDFFIDNLNYFTDQEIVDYAKINNSKDKPLFTSGDDFRSKSNFWHSQPLLRPDPVVGLTRQDTIKILEHFNPDELLVNAQRGHIPYQSKRGMFNSNHAFECDNSEIQTNIRVRPK